MADPMDRFRVQTPAGVEPVADSQPAAPDADPMSRFRVDALSPEIPRLDTRLSEEVSLGLQRGTHGLVGNLGSLASMVGRETGVNWLEDAGNKVADEHYAESASLTEDMAVSRFGEIESAGGFFAWAAGGLGEAIPSMALAIGSGGIGAAAGRRLLQGKLRRSVAMGAERDLVKQGMSQTDAIKGVNRMMNSEHGERFLAHAIARNTGKTQRQLAAEAFKTGRNVGLLTGSAAPQIGQIDKELQDAGIDNSAFTALVGGIAGGALELAPMLRLIDHVFPGVEQQVSKAFIKDFAIASGTQFMLEGGTEAAQEVIQLAALAYHDPTFDMFSPESMDRVIDAFAAGALVGTVTGGGARAIGEVGTRMRGAPEKARNRFNELKNSIPEFRMEQEQEQEDGFVPADKTAYQEIKGRVYGAVAPKIESIVNGARSQWSKVMDAVDENMAGTEEMTFTEIVGEAHNKFLETHKDQLDRGRKFLNDSTKAIYEGAQAIKDPATREEFIRARTEQVAAKLNGWIEQLKEAAGKRDANTQAEVDNMEFPDYVLDELAEQNAREEANANNLEDDVQDSPERVVDLGEPGDLTPPPTQIFGKNQKRPTVGTDGKESVRGYDNREQAEKGLATLMKELATETEEDFDIVVQEDGTYVIEASNPDFAEQIRSNEKFRRAARPTTRDKTRIFQTDGAGHDLGFKRPRLDVITMARQGRDFDPNAKTLADGLRATIGEYLTQGYIDTKTAEGIIKFFEENHGDIAETAATDFAPVGSFFTKGVAQTEMIGFQDKLREKGIQVPRKMLGVRKKEDGTFGYGIQNTRLYKAWRAKDQQATIDFNAELTAQRRQDSLAQASADAREFAGKQTTQGARPAPKKQGDLFDPATSRSSGDVNIKGVTRENDEGKRRDIDARNDTTREARIDVVGRSENISLPVRDEKGREFAREVPWHSGEVGNLTQVGAKAQGAAASNRGLATPVDTKPGADDITTQGQGRNQPRTEDKRGNLSTAEEKGSTLPSEFASRNKPNDPALNKVDKRRRDNAKNLSKHDKKLLSRWGRTGSFKMMHSPSMPVEVQSVLNSLGHFVTKTLGLTNQVTFLDDHGLRLMIEQGLVTDPVFQQTLDDANVNARNIRINDNSFVYLSGKVLSDPAATTLAFGHEMGHHVYRVAWDKLTPEGQQKLMNAFNRTTDAAPFDTDAFNEWMADQLAAWITRPVRQGGDPTRFFFQKVAKNVRRLYDFIKNNKRFQLDQTFKQFADAVAAKAASSIGDANPLAQESINAWFKNDGATMYKWFGDILEAKNKVPRGNKTTPRSAEVDNMEQAIYNFKPVTDGGKKALERVISRYPAVAARAVTMRNWVVNAYNVALAPSTGVIRKLGQRVAEANKLVTIFNRENHGVAKKGSNYHQRVYLMKGQFLEARFGKIMESVEADIRNSRPKVSTKEMNTLRNQKLRDIAEALQAKEGNAEVEFTPIEQEIRALFDDLHAYALEAGLPVRKILNYFPRQLDKARLIKDKDIILRHLEDGGKVSINRARAIYNALISPEAQDGRSTYDATETPGFKYMNSRRGGLDPLFDSYLDTNLEGIVSNYVNAVVKRAEFNRVMGEPFPADTNITAKQAIKSGLWDPKAKMHKLLKQARHGDSQATDAEITLMEQYIDANLGQLGRDDIKPGVRKFMAGVIAYNNLRVLLFTVFASLPDLAGPTIRGNFRSQWKVLRNELHNLASNDSDIAKMARAYGSISSAANEHVMTEYVDNHYMPPKLRKMNDSFFKWTGLNWYTDFTRKMSMATGIEYINEMAEAAGNAQDSKSRARAEAALAELGINKDDVAAWNAAGRPTFLSVSNQEHTKVAEALVQFVDESIMRPNASQRPIMASHPGAMLVYHLKNYLYAVHDIILKRIKYNVDQAESPAQYLAALAPAIGMMLLTAVGLELRELIQYAGSNRKPPTDRMDGWEYTWELMQRSGLTGITQLGIDFEGAEDRGMSHVAGIGGPALSQVGDFLSKPLTQTIPKAIPVLGQIPAARNAVRTVL